VVDPQFAFTLDHQNGEPMIVLILAKWVPRSPVLPARAAMATRERPDPARFDADQLSHRRE
jgi:hypothetical protein